MGKNLYDIPGFDDLLFESRNKEYGAYQLRKRYNGVLFAGILISSFIGSSSVIIPFLLRPASEIVFSGSGPYVQVEMDNLKPPEELYIPPSPPPPESENLQEIVKYVPPVVVDTIIPVDQKQAATDVVLAQSEDLQTEKSGAGFGDNLLSGESGSGEGEAFFLVEVMPTFRGGDLNKFREWITKRINYPQAAIEGNIKGTVFLTFIVETDGSISNVTVLKGVHPLLDSEAVKAISESPKWSPGLQRGQPVRVRYQIPVNFIN